MPTTAPSAQSFRWRPVLVALLIVLSLAAGLGLRQPNPADEPRFVLAARSMVESGQWLLPHRGIELYAEKPPVFMWLQAGAYELTGQWTLAFLLPSLLAALLVLWLVRDLGRRLWHRRIGDIALLAVFCTLQFGLMAKRAHIDMVLLAMTTLSLWGLLRHLLRGPDWPAWWLGAFAAGLGTVTKGVGFLPLLVLLPWALYVRLHGRAWPGRAGDGWRWAATVPMFVAGTAVWLLPLALALWRSDDPALQAYAREILLRQTATRYTAAWHHVQPAWYYLRVIALLWLPGSLLLPALCPGWWRRLRRGDGRQWLLLGWSLLVLLFFSASPGKRELYILPILPAACLAAAPLLPGLLRRALPRRLLLGYVVFLAVASLAVAFGPWLPRDALRRDLDAHVVHQLKYGLIALGVGLGVIAAWARSRRAALGVVLSTAWLWSIYGLVFAPALDASSSSAGLMRRVGERIGPDAQLGMVAWREQNLLQADRPVTEFGFKADWPTQWAKAGPWLAAQPTHRWLFVLREALPACVDRTQVVEIGQSNRNQWLLVPGTAWHAGCTGTPPAQDAADDNDD
ncbi:glycosyltransferase family 39 protein [Stenotrophomonas sp. HITSZ_GD]|uniref:ArnT family glycosyltransferase n=1 Tax=Stenotrophomonas sp. HITSZ_GD TaxID=3037248 RepID=UPI00240E5BBF|nr:glycosyltransferase family 39 protein [Stenotrophomonas sp. HITSZ_GD]MDG2524930.1 glycosyltransferase family 39 protein [Stenotrophomonas sp. HITSZ_GD]